MRPSWGGKSKKSKIETTLETHLGDLVAFAGRLRKDVAQFVPQQKRRIFWKTVFEGAPRDAFKAGNTREAFSMIKTMMHSVTPLNTGGDVSVIRSQNGLAGKLRLEDVAKLQEADRIYFQQGLHENILEMARRDAERQAYGGIEKRLPSLDMMEEDAQNNGLRVVVIAERELEMKPAKVHRLC